jgi:two-component system alkaline phosphatase synthesis response regulator PhoP
VTYKILVVDDEADSRALLRDVLESNDFRVILAERAEQAMAAAADQRPDLVLSDVVLPAMNGLTLCRRLKSDRRTAALPVMLMSAMRRGELEQAEGLELGADDYLVKPVAPRLLLARIHAVLKRRGDGPVADAPLKAGSLVLDPAARVATAGGRQLPLTRKEFDLLALLLEKRGRVLGAPYLLETVWGYDTAVYKDPHTIEVHVSSLRRKLGTTLAKRIVTVPGVGYRFEKDHRS